MKKVSSFGVTNMEDPFAFIIDLCQISASQEQLLRHQPFVGEIVHQSPPSSAAPILMMSMTQTQHPTTGKDASAPKDQEVFLTPREKSLSLPTSGDDPLDHHCTLNQRPINVDDVDHIPQFIDSEATVYVDLGRDSDLGFSDVQLTQLVDQDGSSRGAVGDKFKGFERGIGESEMKKFKLSDPKSGIDSPRACLGNQSQKGNGKGKEKLGSDAKSPFCNAEQGSAKNLGCGEGGKEKNKSKLSCVFDVLKVLSDNCDDEDDEEEDDNFKNLSLLEAFKKRGLSFPRPRWWPDNDSFRSGRIL